MTHATTTLTTLTIGIDLGDRFSHLRIAGARALEARRGPVGRPGWGQIGRGGAPGRVGSPGEPPELPGCGRDGGGFESTNRGESELTRFTRRSRSRNQGAIERG